MDTYSLIAANLPVRRHPPQMDAHEEDRYYASQPSLPHLNLGVIGSIVVTVIVCLLVVII